MVKVLPPKDFAGAILQLYDVPVGQRFGRIYLGRYPDPLSFGKSPSRFSDPRRRAAANRLGVLYLGDTVKVCFLEAGAPRSTRRHDRRSTDGRVGTAHTALCKD
jgi:hypothetical protein